METKLYVSNLPFSIDSSQLERIFSTYGNVESTKIITDRFTGHSRGFGFVEMSTPKEAQEVSPSEVVKAVRELDKAHSRKKLRKRTKTEMDDTESALDDETWRDDLHQVLTKDIAPDGFERLVQRLLRESGFVQVEVTGRTGDGSTPRTASYR